MKNPLLLSAFFLLFSLQNLFPQARYLEPVFDQVTVTPNIQYGENATVIAMSLFGEAILQPLVLDLYEPAGDTALTRPLVIVLSGGQFLPPTANGSCDGTKSDSTVVEICTRLAKMGYVAAAVDYRLGWNPFAPDPQVRGWTLIHALYRGIQDGRTAIRFFKKTVAEDANLFRVDTSRIVLWGESVGGQIALGAAYANEYADWVHPSLIITLPPPNAPIPFIIPTMDGNIWGTDWGIVPPGIPPAFATEGDTLCYPNWPDYSSDFQLCVSMAGLIPDVPWVGAGEIPAVLYHAPNDIYQPCGEGIMTIAPILLPVVPVAGSCSLAEQLDATGNNQVFADAGINDCITANANNLNGGLEGFYPFIGLPGEKGRPWQWVGPCAGNPNAPTDATFARQYLDTVLAYFAPRACAALALCNAQSSNPGGLCGPSVLGKVYIDFDNDGYDPDDLPFPGAVLEMQPGNRHAVSGLAGNYAISAPPGDYTVDMPSLPTYYTTTNTPATVTIPATGDTVQHIGMKPTVNVHDLQVTLTPLTDARPGFYNLLIVRWKNVGTTLLSGTVTLTADANYDVFIYSPFDSMGTTATLTFADLSPMQEKSASLWVYLPSSVPLGTELTSAAMVEPIDVSDYNPSDNTATLLQTVVGSFDPNDKRVSPEGEVTESILANNQNWLDYTIRFQNTGTANAINVLIVDTLSDLLNINTMEVIGTSHPMRWEITGQRTVTWFFDNINLPDSVNNEVASHGFVRYRIKPKLPFSELLNKTARNFADIYFDFNQPVRTNTAESKFVLSSRTNAPVAAGFIHISPNPAREEVTVSCPIAASEAELSIFDVSGKMVMTRRVQVFGQILQTVVQTSDLPEGSYFVKVTAGGEVLMGRFVRE